LAQDLTHFENLRRLLSLERDAERTRRAEEKARLTQAEQEERGLSASELEAVEETYGLGGRVLVTYERPDRRAFLSPFHQGDLVEVRPRKAPDDPPSLALIARARPTRLQLAFDRPPPSTLTEGRIRLDLVPNDVTYERMRKALAAVASLEKAEPKRRRDVLLGGLAPRFGRIVPFEGDDALNPEQTTAVSRALAAEDVYLVHGPPGTGKSHVLAQVALSEVERGRRVLCTAASNAAVDHLLELCLARGLKALRIGHPARVAASLQEHTLDVRVEAHPDRQLSLELLDEAFSLQGYARKQRKQGRSRERFSNARSSAAGAKTLFEEARALEKKAVRSVLEGAQVICATLAGLEGHVLSGERFDIALVDEATQATEPLTLIAFLKADRLVLAGDHQQLPPTLLSPEAAKSALGVPLFERLLRLHGDEVKTMLREQYRMNDAIMSFPSREMYGGQLRSAPGVGSRTLAELWTTPLEAPPVLIIDTAGKGFDEEAEPGTGSYRNEGEVGIIAARVNALRKAGLHATQLAVIAPYSAQVALLRERLWPTEPELEIDTVDAFQGREKDAVLVTLTRSNSRAEAGFLRDLRRMNVALTRAKRHLFLVGDFATLSAEPFYVRLSEHAQTLGGYRSAWEWPEADEKV
jgi:ATP-dependent RNA/DNA helicase IGHMBP2